MRTELPLAAALALLCSALTAVIATRPGPVLAYSTSSDFLGPSVEGGMDGRFFSGASPQGYDCAICHLKPARVSRFVLSATPDDVFDNGEYEPGAEYHLQVKLEDEHAGLESALNLNMFALSVRDTDGGHAGSYRYEESGLGEPLRAGEVLFAESSTMTDRWDFFWRAPEEGRGTLRLYLAGVDGNGNNRKPTGLRSLASTDPRGDDVYSVVHVLAERGDSSTSASAEAAGCAVARTGAQGLVPGVDLGCLAIWWALRRRKSRRRPCVRG